MRYGFCDHSLCAARACCQRNAVLATEAALCYAANSVTHICSGLLQHPRLLDACSNSSPVGKEQVGKLLIDGGRETPIGGICTAFPLLMLFSQKQHSSHQSMAGQSATAFWCREDVAQAGKLLNSP